MLNSVRETRKLPAVPIKAASPIVRELFTIARNRGLRLEALADELGGHAQQLSQYRLGNVEPGLNKVVQIAEALGYRLILEPMDMRPRIRSTEGMPR